MDRAKSVHKRQGANHHDPEEKLVKLISSKESAVEFEFSATIADTPNPENDNLQQAPRLEKTLPQWSGDKFLHLRALARIDLKQEAPGPPRENNGDFICSV